MLGFVPMSEMLYAALYTVLNAVLAAGVTPMSITSAQAVCLARTYNKYVIFAPIDVPYDGVDTGRYIGDEYTFVALRADEACYSTPYIREQRLVRKPHEAIRAGLNLSGQFLACLLNRARDRPEGTYAMW